MDVTMLTLIKNARIYSPRHLGVCDLLVCSNKIAQIDNNIEISGADLPLQQIDAQGKVLIPGLVDSLVHISGGGGEGGFNTRTPELNFGDAVLGGVTTLVGALGTDATTRSLNELHGKARALTADGLSCYHYTGSYQVPVKNANG